MIEFIKTQLKKYRGMLAYLIFGVLTTVINVIVYYICCSMAELGTVSGTVIAWIAAVMFAFFTNKPFVFESHDWSFRTTIREAGSFFACRVGTGIVEVVLMWIFVDKFGVNGTLMKLLTNIIVIILNYIAGKVLVFRKK